MPTPRSTVGQLLQKIRGVSTPSTPPVPDTSQADRKVAAAAQQLRASLASLAQLLSGIEPAALRAPLAQRALALDGQLKGLDDLPDAAARSARLMQVGEALTALKEAVGKVREELAEQSSTVQPDKGTGKEPVKGPDKGKEGEAFKARLSSLLNDIKQAVGKGGEPAEAIKRLNAAAIAAAQRKDFVAAKDALDELEAELALALHESDEVESDEQVPLQPDPEQVKALAQARQGVQNTQLAVAALKAQALVDLGTLPPALAQQFDAIEQSLALDDQPDPVKLDEAVAKASEEAGKLEKAVATLVQRKQAFDADWQLLDSRITALESHAKATVDFVKGKIDAAKDSLAKARALADGHEHDKAMAALPAVALACAEAESLADQHAHYTHVLADRERRVAALTDSPQPPAQALVTAAREKLAKAKNHAAATELPQAVALLNELPKNCIDAAWLVKQAGAYDAMLLKQTTSISNAKSWTSVYEVGPYMPEVEALFESAKYDKTNNYVASVSLLERVGGKLGALFKIIGQFKEFRTDYRAAQKHIQDLAVHAGASGITEPLTRMRADLLFAEGRRNAREYVTAGNVCKSINEQAGKALVLANQCVAYKTRRKEVTDKQSDLVATGYQAHAADVLAEVDTLLISASAKELLLDFEGATKDLDGAMDRCMRAQNVIDNQKVVEGWSNEAEPAINALDTDYDAAHDEFEGILREAKGFDTDDHFGDTLDDAKAKGDQARTLANASPPDYDGARQLLREAIADCVNVVRWVDLRKIIDGLHQGIEQRATALRSEPSVAVLDDRLDDIDQRLSDALAQADQYDYAAAQGTLTSAEQKMIEAEGLSKRYDDYQTLRTGDIQAALDKLDTPKGLAALDVEVGKFKGDVTAADDTLTASKDVPAALTALRKAAAEGNDLVTRLGYCNQARKIEKKYILDEIGAIKNKPPVAADYQLIQAKLVNLKDAFDRRQFKQAENMVWTIYWAILAAKKALEAHDLHEVKRQKALTALNGLKSVACDAVKDDIATVENFMAKAGTLADARNFETAAPLLTKATAWCVKPKALGEAFATYTAALKTAQEAVDGLHKDFPGQEAVALELKALEAQLALARKLADGKSFDKAREVALAIASKGTEARSRAQAHQGIDEAGQRVAALKGDSLDGLEGEIHAVRTLADQLKQRRLPLLDKGLQGIDKLLGDADTALKSGKGAQVVAALAQATKACAQASADADQFTSMDALLKAAETELTNVRNRHAEPAYVPLTLNTLAKQLLLARASAEQTVFEAALNQLHAVQAGLRELDEIGRQHAVYAGQRRLIEQQATDLARHAARFAVAKELGELRAYLGEAGAKAVQRDYPEAMKLLSDAADIAEGAALKADMHDQKEPSEAALKAILDKPDGDKRLDEVIKTLDAQAKRKVCKKALEMRFNMQLELFTDKDGNNIDTDQDKNAPDVLRLYEVMKALPKEHTKDNPSMAKVQRIGEEVGTSSFSSSTRELKLRVGRAEDKTERMISQEWEMGEVDADSKPADTEPPTKFSWTTLHEIGHAVDDRQAFMKGRAGQEEFGGWREYGGNVKEIAQTAAAHFSYDQAYIEAYLAGEKPLRPAAQGVADDIWDRRRIEAESWCDSIRNDKNVYYNASSCERLQINGRVYQEAYAHRWVSYSFAARKKAVSGYQFRAPGEWFAELYAAFHTGKMNKNHPARSWLSKL
ncbi:MAG: hypothetical protein WAQ08_05415 [Aquabacterium sp.]|uniref:hypothetical protein n=1 Tax=Aquabacterium sp. TaxID=1872578 RepID=UPI003BB1AC6D